MGRLKILVRRLSIALPGLKLMASLVPRARARPDVHRDYQMPSRANMGCHKIWPHPSGPTTHFLLVGAGLPPAAGSSQPTCQRPRLPEASSPIMLTMNLTKIKALEKVFFFHAD